MLSHKAPVALIVAPAIVVLAAVLASSAFAGFAADPRIGDVQLGKKNGLAYVKDPETVVDTGSTLAPTGCPAREVPGESRAAVSPRADTSTTST